MTEEFKILSDRDHMLMRPEIFIGSVTNEVHTRFVLGKYKDIEYVPALIKCIDEIIDNCIDEAIRTNFKYANEISVSVDPSDNEVTISDNGRGIPQVKVIDPDGNSILQPVAAWTRAKAGSNFTDDRSGIGANGVGSFCTNVMSFKFEGVTADGEKQVSVKCFENASKVFVSESKADYHGTTVKFIPDFQRFGVFFISDSDIEVIQDRIESLSVNFPKIKFKFNGKVVKTNIKSTANSYGTNVYYEDENVSCFVTGSEEYLTNSYVNGVHTSEGGTHTTYFTNKLIDELELQIKKKYKISIPRNNIRQGLTVGLFLRNFRNPKYTSQIKVQLSNSQAEISPYLKDLPYDKLVSKIVANEDIISPIVDTYIAKKEAEEKRELARQEKKNNSKTVIGHIKASTKNSTLFITEGKSAMNYFIKVRSHKTQGGYAIRGKFLNTWGKKKSYILKNKEASDLINILGLSLTSKDISEMNYQNIAIMTDSDLDGIGSIQPLLLAFFYRWPELFKQGRVRFCRTPIVIATKGNKSQWFYDLEEYESEKHKLTGYKIRYIKGLGSLHKEEYKRAISDEHGVFDVIEIDDDRYFEMLFGRDSDSRKQWISTGTLDEQK